MQRQVIVGLLLASLLQTAWALDPGALPTGGTVVGGSAAITSTSATRLDIQQSSQRTAIDWQTFNIGSAAQVNFAQPNASAVALNRVLAGNASEIAGNLTANGQVFLVNPAGVLFSRTAQVNVGGLVASTLDISAADFMAGKTTFSNSGAAGSVVNQGALAAAAGGYIALLAPEVRNEGLITATLGTVALGAGDRVALDFAGDQLLSLRVEVSAINAEIANRHLVVADGGQVIMSARAAGDVAATVVNNEGVIQAASLVERNGRIFLDARTVSNSGTIAANGAGSEAGGTVSIAAERIVQTATGAIEAKSDSGAGGAVTLQGGYGLADGVALSGRIDASGGSGGSVRILGGGLRLAAASVDASGADAGGTILVGGGYQGSDASIRNAETVDVDGASVLNVSATGQGDGGRAIVWSDGDTRFAGTVYARGGELGGNGGFVETSGRRHLSVADSASVNTLAPHGTAGNWLLDPPDFTIGVDITGAQLGTDLGSTSVTILSGNGSTGTAGDINVNEAVSWSAATVLTLDAVHSVNLNQAITTGGGGSIVISAGSGSFVNNVGGSGLSGGRWLVYSVNPQNDAHNGLTSDFKRYNCTLAAGCLTAGTSIPGTGNGFLYSIAPTLTVVADAKSIVYGTAPVALTFANPGGLIDGDTAGSALTGSLTHAAGGTSGSGNEVVGNYAISQGTLASPLGYQISYTGATYSITVRSVSINNVTANNKVYDAGTAATLNTGTAALAGPSGSTGLIAGDVVNLNGASATGSFADKNVGTGKAVTVSGFAINGAGASNYSLVQPTGVTANITARSVGINSVTANNKVYDGGTVATLNTGTAALAGQSGSTGFIAGDTVTLNSGSATGAFADKNVGTGKAVTASGFTISGTDAGNYSLVQPTGVTANITAKTVTLAATRDYNGLTTFVAGQFTVVSITGTVGTETLTIASGQGSVPSPNAGSAQTLTIGSLALGNGTNGGLAANYAFAASGHTGTITATQIIVDLAGTRVYDGTPNFTAGAFTVVSITGTINGETLTIASGTGTVPSRNVGTYTLTIGSLTLGDGTGSASNYTLVGGTHTATITQRPITVTAATNTKTYDGNTTAAALPTITSGSLGTGDTLGFIESYSDKNAGTGKTLIPSGAVNDGNSGANYNVTLINNTTGVINQKAVTLSGTRVYDGATSFTAGAFTVVSITGTVGTETLTIAGGAGSVPTKNVGTQTLTPGTLALGDGTNGGLAANYVFAGSGHTGTITQRPITVTAASNTKVYDGNATAGALPTITSGSLVGGDTALLAETYNNKNVGSGKTLTPSANISDGNGGANYSITLIGNTTGVITARALTVTATGVNKIYDGTTTATATLGDDRVAGDVLTLSNTAATFTDNKNVGTAKPVSVTGINVTGTDSGNYTFNTTASTTADVTVRVVQLTAAPNTKVYDGGTAAAAVPTVTGGTSFAAGDGFTLSETYTNKDVATGKTLVPAATINDGNNGLNYALQLVNNNSGVITAKTVTVVATRTFDGTTVFAAAGGANPNPITATINGTVAGETLTLAANGGQGSVPNKDVAAGTQVLTLGTLALANGTNGGLASNYVFAASGHTGTITNAGIVVNLAASRPYDGTGNFTAGSFTFTLTGQVAGETPLTIASGTGTVPNANVSAGTQTLSIGNLMLGDGPPGPNQGFADNYTLIGGTNTGTITPKTVTFAATRPYDATTSFAATGANPLVPTFVGTALGQTLTIASGVGSVPNANVSAGTQTLTVGSLALGNGPPGANQGLASNYALATNGNTGTVTATPVSITATRAYDATANFAAASITPAMITGTVSGQTLTIASGTGTVSSANVSAGQQVLNVGTAGGLVLGNGTGLAANYTLVGGTHTGTITAKPVNIAATRVYDGTSNFLAASITPAMITGTVGGQTLTIAGGGIGTVPSRNVGTQTLNTGTLALGNGTGTATNYTLVGGTHTGTITARPITVTPVSDTKVYDGTTGSVAPTITGGLGTGDTSGFVQTFDNRNVGTGKTLTASGAVNDGNGGLNYAVTFSQPVATGTITQATLTVTASSNSKVYDGDTSAAAIPNVSGLQTGDNILTLSEVYANKDAGSNKVLTPSATYSDGNGGLNYTLVLVDNTNGTISQRALTITADDQTRAVNTPNPVFTATVSGLAPGDSPDPTVVLAEGDSLAPSLSGTLAAATPATNVSPVGTYTITASGLSSGNYDITYNDGTLTVCLPGPGCGAGNAAVGNPGDPVYAAIGSASQGTSGDPYSGAGASGRHLSEPPVIDDNGRLERIRYSDSVSLAIRDGGLKLPEAL